MAGEATPSTPIAAVEESEPDKASSDRSNLDRALVLSGNAASRQSPTPMKSPKAPSPKRRKGVKGPILL